jgi:hypothetical protein
MIGLNETPEPFPVGSVTGSDSFVNVSAERLKIDIYGEVV